MYSLEDVTGQHDEPIARLALLGWTSIGNPAVPTERTQTNFTFFLSDKKEVSNLVRHYWDVEEPKETLIVNPLNKLASYTVAKSLNFVNGHYVVGMPWKSARPLIPDDYSIAFQHLQSTERKLKWSPDLGEAYEAVLQTYRFKGYIRKVPHGEAKPWQARYLPHFPVLRPDKAMTKTRIVFDASANYRSWSWLWWTNVCQNLGSPLVPLGRRV